MSSECERTQATMSVLLGQFGDCVSFTLEDYENAFLHVKRCFACRGALSTEERATFFSRVIEERE